MKKKFMVLVFFLMISVVTGCKSEKADISFADISAEYFASQDFTKNFEVKSSGVDYKEVKYLSGDVKEIKGWGGKIKVRAKGNVRIIGYIKSMNSDNLTKFRGSLALYFNILEC